MLSSGKMKDAYHLFGCVEIFGERELMKEGVGVNFTFTRVSAEVEHLLYRDVTEPKALLARGLVGSLQCVIKHALSISIKISYNLIST